MKNRFNQEIIDQYRKQFPNLAGDMLLRIVTTRLIGQNPDLVLHGGGNTSVKCRVKDITGIERDILYVKGSGHDMSVARPESFPGLVLENLKRLEQLEALSDEEMVNQLRINTIQADAPTASIEGLLHAFLPHKYIDHSHADAILVLTNSKNGTERIREALGSKAVIIPYLKPGFLLAKRVSEASKNNPDAEAIIALNHGIFTFGPDAETAYSRMIDYVSRAEKFIAGHQDPENVTSSVPENTSPNDQQISRLTSTIRGACSFFDHKGKKHRFYVELRNNADMVKASLSTNAEFFCRSGVLTPDHAIRTKNSIVFIDTIPEDNESFKRTVEKAVQQFRDEYDTYFQTQIAEKQIQVLKLDHSPRLFMVRGVGLLALGFSRKWARIAADIAEHTIRAKQSALSLGDYQPISEAHVFDLEYMNMQQQKLEKTDGKELQGQVAIVTGAAGAIGFGIADCLLQAGAVVVITDLDRTRLETVEKILAEKHNGSHIESLVFDITDYGAVEKALIDVCKKLGGIDIVVPNAGIAHVAKIEELDPQKFAQVMDVNLMGVFNLIKASIPVLRQQQTGGNIVLISSKNVFDPGAAFGAYSASKAAAHQLSRIAALELAEIGVRVNMINPDAVFGDEKISSGLWDLIGPDRMKSRGLDPQGLREYYRERNMLKETVLAEHVGNAVVFFASEKTPTTGATLPVDGGVASAAPR
ncbi:MAG: bifunctional aldolase/short-chain dehydrogenase [Deltaproteobacteria bacterium]|nr:bifunctional aldolase/short-chain dehydrogenase [Deltaproteobacteria bacterium]MBT4091076.1 bifunctional aldolase/short-chain dehydrogenase [Deltaproteobacteria bacterium]MBT4641997.1 bifunctional aldolase/short-chain dehydrogenase [Deltaproteobacteria bacterium]MBT6499603.1 bifunctional aldolase/short-chain dehydrogenase [Deltaproteobacteria bacterium]MBT7154527.1 bifunctional aldolase/short-chain dehydrogenase [Deltaproteobacteria bacterium]